MSISMVLAIRIGSESVAPARVAAELSRQLGARITVVYVAAELKAHEVGAAAAGVDPGAEMERAARTAESALAAFAAEHLADVPTTLSIVRGGVAEQVSRSARETGASYIVVGTKGRGGLARLVLGDTTQDILQHAPCPVIVVPLRDEAGKH